MKLTFRSLSLFSTTFFPWLFSCRLSSSIIISGNTAPSPCGLELKAYRDRNGVCQWQTLVFHINGFSWWIKVVLQGKLSEGIESLSYLKRRFAFQEFVRAIDFGQLELLDDTMSNIVLTMTDRTEVQSRYRKIYILRTFTLLLFIKYAVKSQRTVTELFTHLLIKSKDFEISIQAVSKSSGYHPCSVYHYSSESEVCLQND